MKNAEFTALILAATSGARLYPLTTTKNDLHASDTSEPVSKYMPKHMLPIAGRPNIYHLIEQCVRSGLSSVVIVIGSEDDITQQSLINGLRCDFLNSSYANNTIKALKYCDMDIALVKLPLECAGSADALRYVKKQGVVPSNSHLIVLPSDLVLYGHLSSKIDSDALGSLVDMHRREYINSKEKAGMPLAMTMLLGDVGDEDEHGIPLKESAKVRNSFSLSSYLYRIIHT